MKIAVFLTAVGLAAPAFADGYQPDLSDLVTDTLGYVNLAPGVVILEGEDMGTFVCKFDFTDAAFANYRQVGDIGFEEIGYSCIPIEEFEE